MTTTDQGYALYYRSGSRRRKGSRDWRLHNVYATRPEADAATAEIESRFRHLDLMVAAVESTATADTELTATQAKNFRVG